MSTENVQFRTTIEALEDLNTHQYLAFCLADGKLANNAEEASGILQNKPKQYEHATITYIGESKYKAGLAVSKGDKLTVTTSGYFTQADSNDPVIGEAKFDVTSGSVGTGIFVFPTGRDQADSILQKVTPLVDVLAGCVLAFDDMDLAGTGEEADGVAISAMTSGTEVNAAVFGMVQGRMLPSECSSIGDVLTVVESGYFSLGDSGDYIAAKALANVGSNAQGAMLFNGMGHYLSV